MRMLRTRSVPRERDKERWNTTILGATAFAVVSLMDVATTWYALKYTSAIEGNPFMQSIAQSVPLMLLVKASGLALIVAVVHWTISFVHWHKWIWIALCSMTFIAVINNLIVIGRGI